MNEGQPPAPPRLTWLLFRWLCPAEWQDGILGDLLEELDERTRRTDAAAARAWLRRQLLQSAGYFLLARSVGAMSRAWHSQTHRAVTFGALAGIGSSIILGSLAPLHWQPDAIGLPHGLNSLLPAAVCAFNAAVFGGAAMALLCSRLTAGMFLALATIILVPEIAAIGRYGAAALPYAAGAATFCALGLAMGMSLATLIRSVRSV